MSSLRAERRRSWWKTALLVPVAAVVALPFYYILVNTLKTQQETARTPLALPTTFNFDNYVTVFETTPLVQSFLNTLFVTATSVALMVFVGSLAAFGMIMRRSVINRVIGVALLLAFMVPFQSTLIPLYQMMADVRLVDSLSGLVALYSAGAVFCYFIIQGYMRTVPMEIIEAARIDGCSMFGIYWRVVLPLIRPILVTVSVFQVMWVWNDFITPNVFLSSPEKKTLVLQVYSAVGEFAVNWPAFMTLTVLVLIPMVIFFATMQKHIVSGLVSGGVKA